MNITYWPHWEQQFRQYVNQIGGDAAHDVLHIERVVANATALARAEGADLAVVLPAAWLHDCVAVPKDSLRRKEASTLASRAAVRFLRTIDYPECYLPAVGHAIEAHSFSAGITPRTTEAKVVQDADRLDALGAVGLARCLMLGGATGRPLYNPEEPFPETRVADDRTSTLDHLYTKLLHLADRMNTNAGRTEARKRTAFMENFLTQLRQELSGPFPVAEVRFD